MPNLTKQHTINLNNDASQIWDESVKEINDEFDINITTNEIMACHLAMATPTLKSDIRDMLLIMMTETK